MASLTTDENGNVAVYVTMSNGRRRPVRLGKMDAKEAGTIRDHIAEIELSRASCIDPRITTRTWLEAAGRHARIAKDFIPNGGAIEDLSLRGQYAFHQQWHFEAFVQHENWVYPILAATPQSNWTSSIAITFEPRILK